MNTQTENIGRDALSDRDVFTEGPKYNKPPKKTRIKWYRCRVSRETLRELNKRSDLLGFAQTLGFLGVLTLAAGAAIYASRHWPWYITCYSSSSTGTSGIFWSTAFTNWYTTRSSRPDGSIASSSASYPSWAGTTTISSGPAIPNTTNTPCTRPTIRKSYSRKKSTSKGCGNGPLSTTNTPTHCSKRKFGTLPAISTGKIPGSECSFPKAIPSGVAPT